MERTVTPMLTLGEAAKHSGISKATLSRAIKSGRMSARRNEKNGFDIDPAELFRAFPRNSSSNSFMEQSVTGAATGDATDDPAALRAEVEGLKAQLALMREHMADTKDQRDKWQRQAEDAQRLLADQRPARRGWFGLRG